MSYHCVWSFLRLTTTYDAFTWIYPWLHESIISMNGYSIWHVIQNIRFIYLGWISTILLYSDDTYTSSWASLLQVVFWVHGCISIFPFLYLDMNNLSCVQGLLVHVYICLSWLLRKKVLMASNVSHYSIFESFNHLLDLCCLVCCLKDRWDLN